MNLGEVLPSPEQVSKVGQNQSLMSTGEPGT